MPVELIYRVEPDASVVEARRLRAHDPRLVRALVNLACFCVVESVVLPTARRITACVRVDSVIAPELLKKLLVETRVQDRSFVAHQNAYNLVVFGSDVKEQGRAGLKRTGVEIIVVVIWRLICQLEYRNNGARGRAEADMI